MKELCELVPYFFFFLLKFIFFSLFRTLDYAILMTYDYFERNKTSIGAALFQDNIQRYKETVSENIERIIGDGCGRDKIIMGISTFGKIYKLKVSSKSFIGAAAVEYFDSGVGYNKVKVY